MQRANIIPTRVESDEDISTRPAVGRPTTFYSESGWFFAQCLRLGYESSFRKAILLWGVVRH
jgi:hypothetical protein